MASPIRMPVGFYCMAPLGQGHLVKDEVLSNPNVAGMVLRQRWSEFNPALDKFDFSYLESQFTRCKKFKKKIILSIYTGTCSPLWLQKPPHKVFFYDGAPYPWDNTMHDLHSYMVQALGDHFNSDPSLSAVELSGPTFDSNELHYAPGLTKRLGYSVGKMTDAWETCIDQYARYFPSCGLLSCGGISGQGSKGPVTRTVFDYLLKEYPKQGVVSHCALKASTTPTAVHHALVTEYAKKGLYAGFEMVGPSIDSKQGRPVSRFGGKFSTAIALGKKANARFFKYYMADTKFIKLP
jgi:hypothetical protein